MKKNKIMINLGIIISIIFCIPSIIYLLQNKTVDGFNSYYTYNLANYSNTTDGILNGIIFIGLIIIFSIIYVYIIKNEKEIFKNFKHIFIYILLISIIFMLTLPTLSSDIYYYIGDSWLSAKYGENPYYTSVNDLQNQGINDTILQNTGYWKTTTSVYGPLWNFIAKILVTLSFGNITIALYIFKIAALITHLGLCYLIYKLTNSTKNVLIYGLNPLVLVELLSNVHNDIYLILFVFLSLYFIIKKKNIYLAILAMSCSIAIKYSTVLIVPFLLLYYFKEEKMGKKLAYCIISGLSIILLVVIMYMPYYKDLTIFTNMLVQNEKFSQSIRLFLFQNLSNKFSKIIGDISLPIFAIIYVGLIIKLLIKNEKDFGKIINSYNWIMLAFIFLILTNFQKWYILWLLPTALLQNKNLDKFIIITTLVALIPSFNYFIIGCDAWDVGMTYSINILLLSIIIYFVGKYIKTNIKIENKK